MAAVKVPMVIGLSARRLSRRPLPVGVPDVLLGGDQLDVREAMAPDEVREALGHYVVALETARTEDVEPFPATRLDPKAVDAIQARSAAFVTGEGLRAPKAAARLV